MVTYEEALQKALQALDRPVPATVPLEQSAGYLLAEEIRATVAWPRYDTALTEGWCVASEQTQDAGVDNPVNIICQEAIQPGDNGLDRTIGTHKGAVVLPGARIPEGGDTIVPHEFEIPVVLPATLSLTEPVPAGEAISKQHTEYAEQEVMLSVGTVITPVEVALLASQGWLDVPVWAKPIVALLTAGNDLMDAGSPLSSSSIYNMVGPCLYAALEKIGIMPIDLGTTDDDPEAIESNIEQGLCANLILVCGGMSRCKAVDTQELELMTAFDQENLVAGIGTRPGHLLRMFRLGSALVCWLPGSPGAVLSQFHLFVAPLVRALMGYSTPHPEFVPAVLSSSITKPEGVSRSFHPVSRRWNAEGKIEVTPLVQTDYQTLKNLPLIDGVIDVPAGTVELKAGDAVSLLLW